MLASLLLITTLATDATTDTVVRLRSGAAIEIDAPTCTVVLRVGNDDRLNVVGGTIEADAGSAEVGCPPFRMRDGRGNGTLTVTIPARSRVEVSSVSGNISLTGVTERFEATTMNGTIRVVDGGGRMNLESVAGPVSIMGFRGEALAIDAVAGAVILTDVTASGRLNVESVNGNVRFDKVRASALNGTTVNGSIEFTGALDPDGSYSFESHNGGITLTLPGTTSARLRVASVMGDFETELRGVLSAGSRQAPTPLPTAPRAGRGRTAPPVPPVTGVMEESEFTVVYGKGEARVNVESFNGPIRVKVAK